MKNKIIFFSFFYLVFASCQKDSVPVSVVDGDKSIVCQVSIMGANDTKSGAAEPDTLKKYGFCMDAWLEEEHRSDRRDLWPQLDKNPHYIKDANITFTDGKWKSSVDTVFWTNQIWTNFWAQYPYSPTGRGDLTWDGIADEQQKKPWFTYNMSSYSYPENTLFNAAEVTPDLLVAYSRVKYDVDADTTQPSEGVYFRFAHALSAINFSALVDQKKYRIDSIMISGIHVMGDCHLSLDRRQGVEEKDSVLFTWKVTDTPSTDKAICQNFDVMNDTTYIFWVPQQLPVNAVCKVHISLVPGGGGDVKNERWYETPIGGTWRPGYKYVYTLHHIPDLHLLTVTVDEKGYKVIDGVWDEE